MRTLLYQDKEKALFKQDAFFILFERTPTIEFNQGGTGKYLNELPEWYEMEVRNQKINDLLQHLPSNNDDKKV